MKVCLLILTVCSRCLFSQKNPHLTIGKKDFVIKTHGKPIASNFNTNICKQLYVLIWFSFLTSNCPDKFPWNLVKHLRYLTTFWVRICIYRIPPTYPSKSFRDVTCMLLNIKSTIFSDGLIHMSTASLFV